MIDFSMLFKFLKYDLSEHYSANESSSNDFYTATSMVSWLKKFHDPQFFLFGDCVIFLGKNAGNTMHLKADKGQW